MYQNLLNKSTGNHRFTVDLIGHELFPDNVSAVEADAAFPHFLFDRIIVI